MAPLAVLVKQGGTIVFTSPDGSAAEVAAREARRTWPDASLRWLEGGTQAWVASGKPVQADYAPADLLTPFDDDWGSVMRVPESDRGVAWQEYLAWERGIASRVTRDPTVRFRWFQH